MARQGFNNSHQQHRSPSKLSRGKSTPNNVDANNRHSKEVCIKAAPPVCWVSAPLPVLMGSRAFLIIKEKVYCPQRRVDVERTQDHLNLVVLINCCCVCRRAFARAVQSSELNEILTHVRKYSFMLLSICPIFSSFCGMSLLKV